MHSLRVFVNMAVEGRLVNEFGMTELPTRAVVAYKESVHEHVHNKFKAVV